jgi:hypothetical protein
MANTLSAFNPIFYAQEGLIALEKALGMAGRVFRGYDDVQTSRNKGDTITITVPGSFVAEDAPSTAQDIVASSLDVKLDQWKEVKFALTDKELSYTSQLIIEKHIRPAAYALADKIDSTLVALVDDVPWISDWSAPAAVTDITTGFHSGMFDNKVDFSDPSKLHCMVSGTIQGELLGLSAFSQWQGAGPAGAETQMRGTIGTRYGFEFFANQNVPSRTSATVADLAGAINKAAGYAKGIKSIDVDGFTISAALKKGDVVVITGHTQRYVLTADVTLDGSGTGTLAIFGSPFVAQGGLEAAVADNVVVTITLAGGSGATKVQTLAFHQGFAALGMAKLPDFFDGEGVKVFATPIDTGSGLSVRARTWSDANNSKYYVALDCLFGVKTLDGNKAWRMRD